MNDLLYDQLTYENQAAAEFRQAVPETRYHKHREYLSYGLKAAELWRIMKAFRPRIITEPLAERLELAARLLDRHIGELGHAASIYWQKMRPGWSQAISHTWTNGRRQPLTLPYRGSRNWPQHVYT